MIGTQDGGSVTIDILSLSMFNDCTKPPVKWDKGNETHACVSICILGVCVHVVCLWVCLCISWVCASVSVMCVYLCAYLCACVSVHVCMSCVYLCVRVCACVCLCSRECLYISCACM